MANEEGFFKQLHNIFDNILHFAMSITYHRDNRIVLFGSWQGDRFADNPRFLFQYLSENKKILGLTHVVWVTRDKELEENLRKLGYEVYMIGSKESDKFHKVAGMHLLCNVTKGDTPDIDVKWSYGAIRVNLWHGVGVVKGAIENSLDYKRKKKEKPFIYALKEGLEKNKIFKLLAGAQGGWGYSYFLSPTPTDNLQLQHFKYIPPKLFIQAAYPRTCCCENLLEDEKKLLEFIKNYKFIVLYLPTFRLNDTEYECIQLADEVSDILLSQNALWIQKAHSVSKSVYNPSDLDHNILNLDPRFDINVIMPYIDILVTDYSSAASDARYFRKKILFFLPDYDRYRNGENGFTEEADELLYGPRSFTLHEFRQSLLQTLEGNYEYLDEEYEHIRSKYWGNPMSMEEIWRAICIGTGYKTKKSHYTKL